VITDALLAMWAFLLAYGIRVRERADPVTKGFPPIDNYLNVLPFVALLSPRRSISRVCTGCAAALARGRLLRVLIGSILAVVFAVGVTLYLQTYYVSEEAKTRGAYEVSQLVWAMFLTLNVNSPTRRVRGVRELLERRWRAGIGLKRILVAGAAISDVWSPIDPPASGARLPIVGFIDDRAGRRPHRLPRACRCSARSAKWPTSRSANRGPSLRRAADGGAARSCSRSSKSPAASASTSSSSQTSCSYRAARAPGEVSTAADHQRQRRAAAGAERAG